MDTARKHPIAPPGSPCHSKAVHWEMAAVTHSRTSSPGSLCVISALPLLPQDPLLGCSQPNLPSHLCITLSWQASQGRAHTREALIAAGGFFRKALVPGNPHFLVPSVLGTSKKTHPKPTLRQPPQLG